MMKRIFIFMMAILVLSALFAGGCGKKKAAAEKTAEAFVIDEDYAVGQVSEVVKHLRRHAKNNEAAKFSVYCCTEGAYALSDDKLAEKMALYSEIFEDAVVSDKCHVFTFCEDGIAAYIDLDAEKFGFDELLILHREEEDGEAVWKLTDRMSQSLQEKFDKKMQSDYIFGDTYGDGWCNLYDYEVVSQKPLDDGVYLKAESVSRQGSRYVICLTLFNGTSRSITKVMLGGFQLYHGTDPIVTFKRQTNIFLDNEILDRKGLTAQSVYSMPEASRERYYLTLPPESSVRLTFTCDDQDYTLSRSGLDSLIKNAGKEEEHVILQYSDAGLLYEKD